MALRKSALREAESPLREALQGVGVNVDSVWDLVNTASPYPAAIPVLLCHLRRAYPGRVREGIARALAVRESRAHWSAIRELFRNEPPGIVDSGDVKFAIALALSASATKDLFQDIVDLLRDRSNGEARLGLVRVLTRFKEPSRDAILQDLSSEPDLRIEIGEMIKRLRRRRRNAG
jgi:hypothetical protein